MYQVHKLIRRQKKNVGGAKEGKKEFHEHKFCVDSLLTRHGTFQLTWQIFFLCHIGSAKESQKWVLEGK